MLKPPTLRPRAWSSNSPLLHLLRVDERELQCYLQNVLPSQSLQQHQLVALDFPKEAAKFLQFANGKIDLIWCCAYRIALECLATEHQFCATKECHLEFVDGREQVDLYGPFVVAVVV